MFNIKTIGVTELIDLFKPKFDKDLWSSIKALQELITKAEFDTIKNQVYKSPVFNKNLLDRFNVDNQIFLDTKKKILEQWELANTIAYEKGEVLHKQLEEQYVDNAMLFSPLTHSNDKFLCITNGQLVPGQKAIYPEFSINYIAPDDSFAIVGRVDLVSVDDTEIDIQDYKTCKEIKKTGYFDQVTKKHKKMKFPVSNLADCNFNHYALQLSLYAWMIEQKNPDLHIRSLSIKHFKDIKTSQVLEVPYLKKDVEAMVSAYKKTLKITTQYDKLKPFKY